MMDRIEITYKAINQMIESHKKPRPEQFGCGRWDAKEEFRMYKLQVGNRYTKLQWRVITHYFKNKFRQVIK